MKPLPDTAGHRVTALDLATSGIDSRSLHELQNLNGYTWPLLELIASLSPQENVVLVGHSVVDQVQK
ncbi:salicylic acid-binding protein 2 [Phtheirospermum japonicum]|uniref:Salicylic acid-binding protein 2 n=1 Tax=Phtheirospermum japonicum TaxID=374723 RepID=A0A830BA05_9LAMI|nr:salicylic acid-binding protein 2 [Phtheirospermum japonicum]